MNGQQEKAMPEESSEKKYPAIAFTATHLHGAVAKPGWTRRILLAIAVVLFVVILAILRSGLDYRTDPSVLVPRSALLYAETRDLELLLRNIGAWPLWDQKHRRADGDKRSQVQEAVAARIGALVPGLGAQLPLLWTTGAGKAAALAIGKGDNELDQAWALYLNVADPKAAVDDIGVEPGLKVEPMKGTSREGLYTLTGPGGEKVVLGVLAPWLVISSDAILPEFAIASARRPANSIAHTNILPDWQRNISARGVLDPVYASDRPDLAPLMRPAAPWLDPSARLAYTARLDSAGGIDANLRIVTMSEQITGGGAWPVVKFLLFLIWLACIAVIVVILLAMIGWSGWLKALAVKAGAKPKDAPAPAEPSPAFREDAGAPQTEPAEEKRPDESPSDSAAAQTAESGPEPDADHGIQMRDATESSAMHDTKDSTQKDQ